MAMENHGNWGYTIKVKELLPLLHLNRHKEFKELLDQNEEEELEELLSKHLPPGFPPVSGIFHLSDEDESDDLEHGEIYAFFEFEDLFTKTETPEMVALKAAGVTPSQSRWFRFGNYSYILSDYSHFRLNQQQHYAKH